MGKIHFTFKDIEGEDLKEIVISFNQTYPNIPIPKNRKKFIYGECINREFKNLTETLVNLLECSKELPKNTHHILIYYYDENTKKDYLYYYNLKTRELEEIE